MKSLGSASILAWAVALASGCAEPPAPPAAAPTSTAPATPMAPPAGASATSAPEGTGPSAAPLLPPTTPGASRTALAGCLAGTGEAADGARFPPRVATRGGPGEPEVTVSKTGTGVIVTHDLGHACCLKATVQASVERGAVTIDETLAGQPCRCQCQSAIRTAVGLAPGQYDLSVRLHQPDGSEREVQRQDVEIRRLRDP